MKPTYLIGLFSIIAFIAFISLISYTPIIMDDEAAYIINTLNFDSFLQLGEKNTFLQRPLLYSLINVPAVTLLRVFSIYSVRSVYLAFLTTNILLFFLTYSLCLTYLNSCQVNKTYIKSSLALLIIFFPGLFYYQFFAMTETLLIFLVSLQILSTLCIQKRFHNFRLVFLSLVFQVFVTFCFIITKENGIVAAIFPFSLSILYARVTKCRWKYFSLFLPIILLTMLLLLYKQALPILTGTSFLDRAGGMSLYDLLSQLKINNNQIKFTQNFIKLLFYQSSYLMSLTLGVVALSTFSLISDLKKIKSKCVISHALLTHYTATVALLSSLMVSVTFFSLFSLRGTLGMHHLFYERYSEPYLFAYLITLIPNLKYLKTKTKKYHLFFLFLSATAFLNIIIEASLSDEHVHIFHIPSLSPIFTSFQTKYYFLFVYLCLLFFFYMLLNFFKENDFRTVTIYTFLILCLFFMSNYTLLKQHYIPEQASKGSQTLISKYLNQEELNDGDICYYQPSYSKFYSWHYKFQLRVMNYKLRSTHDDGLSTCSYIIARSNVLPDAHFTPIVTDTISKYTLLSHD